LSSSSLVRPNIVSHQQQKQRQRQQQQQRFISSSNLTIEYVPNDGISKFDQRPSKEKLVFGTTTTDHMLLIEWDKINHWKAPKIIPYQNLSISPAASCLHYGKKQKKNRKIIIILHERTFYSIDRKSK
jgi:hypothetical protein